jgi:hypothetical protein
MDGVTLTPEQIFEMFFNQGGGGQFQQRTFHAQFRRPQPQARAQREPEEGGLSWMQVFSILPLIYMLIIALSGTFSSNPDFSVSRTAHYQEARAVGGYPIRYYVNGQQYRAFVGDSTTLKEAFDTKVLSSYESSLRQQCNRDRYEKKRLEREASGLFWRDEEQLARLQRLRLESCEELDKLLLYYQSRRRT